MDPGVGSTSRRNPYRFIGNISQCFFKNLLDRHWPTLRLESMKRGAQVFKA
tara:strand:+ start:197 stop:349 length:153 start_codon:yes stop_codon:yes gene_type:complete